MYARAADNTKGACQPREAEELPAKRHLTLLLEVAQRGAALAEDEADARLRHVERVAVGAAPQLLEVKRHPPFALLQRHLDAQVREGALLIRADDLDRVRADLEPAAGCVLQPALRAPLAPENVRDRVPLEVQDLGALPAGAR